MYFVDPFTANRRMRQGLIAGVVLSLATVACGGDAASPEQPFRILQRDLSLQVAQTAQLTTEGATEPVSWQSSAPSVATISSTGFINALFPGVATITAAVGQRRATVDISVAATRLTVSPSPVRLAVGQARTLAVDVLDANNRAIAGVQATWSSLNPSVATVDRLTGVVTAIAIGNATIAATAGGVSGEAQIVVTPPAIAFTEISTQKAHVCGISQDGQVYCWGLNTDWQLGDGTFDTRSQPTPVRKSPFTVRSISAGSRHTCAIAQSGVRWCWGGNKGGELGIGSMTGTSTPVSPAQESIAFVSVRSGSQYTCGVETQTGAGYCWGENTLANLGDGTTTRHTSPTRVGGNVRFSVIQPNSNHTCGLEAETEIAYCWGSNFFGELGISPPGDSRSAPQAVGGGTRFNSITVGYHHTCAIESGTGIAYCWGANADGALGDGTTTNRAVPTPVTGGRAFASISAGTTHTCGVEARTGIAFCWGRNDNGELGDGTLTSRLTPTRVDNTDRFAMIVTGWHSTCALRADNGHAYCWGANDVGQLGFAPQGLAVLVPSPVDGPNK